MEKGDKGEKGDTGKPGGLYQTRVLNPNTLQADIKNFLQDLTEEEAVEESDICRGQLFIEWSEGGNQIGFSVPYVGRISTGNTNGNTTYTDRFGFIIEVRSITSDGEVTYKNFFVEDKTSLTKFLKQVSLIAPKDKLLITNVADNGWDVVGKLASGATTPSDYKFTLKIYIDHEV